MFKYLFKKKPGLNWKSRYNKPMEPIVGSKIRIIACESSTLIRAMSINVGDVFTIKQITNEDTITPYYYLNEHHTYLFRKEFEVIN